MLWLLLPLVAGYCWAGWTEREVPLGLGLSVMLCTGAVFALKRHPAWAVPLAAAALVPLAARHHLACLPPHTDWNALPPREAVLEVQIEALQVGSLPRIAGFGEVHASVQPLEALAGAQIFFNAAPFEQAPEPGDRIELRGVLSPLPSAPRAQGFDRHLAASGARFKLERATILRLERSPQPRWVKLGPALNATMASWLTLGLEAHPELASHYLALKLGAKSGLSDEQKLAYRRTGTLHLFAISGMNIGVVALSVHVALRMLRLGRKSAASFGAAAASLFVLATGASASASRALLMLLTLHAATLLNRHTTPLAVWTSAAFIVLLFDPGALFAAGFQLSFCVVLGLILYAVPLDLQWEHSKIETDFTPPPEPGPMRRWMGAAAVSLRAGLCASIAATLCSLPACISNFGGFSIGGILANILLVPLASLVVISGLCALGAGAFGFPTVGALFNHSAALSLVVMDALARLCARIPGIHWSAEWRFEGAGGVSTFLILGTILAGSCMRWRPAHWLLAPPIATALCLGLFARISPG